MEPVERDRRLNGTGGYVIPSLGRGCLKETAAKWAKKPAKTDQASLMRRCGEGRKQGTRGRRSEARAVRLLHVGALEGGDCANSDMSQFAYPEFGTTRLRPRVNRLRADEIRLHKQRLMIRRLATTACVLRGCGMQARTGGLVLRKQTSSTNPAPSGRVRRPSSRTG